MRSGSEIGSAFRARADSVRARIRLGWRGSGGLGRGVAFRGTVWPGGAAEPFDGVLIADADGRVSFIGPMPDALPDGLRVLGAPGCWVGPGVVDAHVHLAFGSVADCLPAGLVAVRDLGAPLRAARRWHTGHRPVPPGRPFVAVAGPVLTAVQGYPSQSWGADGFAAFVASAQQASETVHRLVSHGVDVVKIAFEPGAAGWPVPSPGVARAVVEVAHGAGLAVVAHALSADMVARALDAGVDELAHTPTERLADALVERIAASGVAVVSTLQTFFAQGSDAPGPIAAANAQALHRAGAVLRYGTDFGNAGTILAVDPRELRLLADAGLGPLGALRAATELSAAAPGIRRRTGHLRLGEPAALVLLAADPTVEPDTWRAPLAVLADGRLVAN